VTTIFKEPRDGVAWMERAPTHNDRLFYPATPPAMKNLCLGPPPVECLALVDLISLVFAPFPLSFFQHSCMEIYEPFPVCGPPLPDILAS
jgi:hypothetical protein